MIVLFSECLFVEWLSMVLFSFPPKLQLHTVLADQNDSCKPSLRRLLPVCIAGVSSAGMLLEAAWPEPGPKSFEREDFDVFANEDITQTHWKAISTMQTFMPLPACSIMGIRLRGGRL